MTGRGRHSASRRKSREELGTGQGTGGHPSVAAESGTASKVTRLSVLSDGSFLAIFFFFFFVSGFNRMWKE